MARMYKISQDCTGCGKCREECPSDAIQPQGDVYVIDQEACTKCGICEDACSIDAIFDE
ncbi:MAG: 4Fe-4S binding protein [Candidatus Margulisbacteria bacterium]|nr:4Fe-4S binding protein [Candidatus Margulisiibacteriota bacterium]MBU1021956.1 4Fe-4S binding protein [Candidatus Margulisiibacteriota bacterium]MBU1728935.1 4Fe-4S binding protein [Candidatus Margulisiibacteriota bacterium]MBU1954741.1 4Fe-4S binding protein [Candidatus Margulisiibacteriota bacterium]